MNTLASFPLRSECPPGACTCGRDALLQDPQADLRIMYLTRAEEKRLVQRLESLVSLADLHHMQQLMQKQLGLELQIHTSGREVRTLRGITILVVERPGLCRKTRQAIPAAIKRSLEQRPEIAFELLDAQSLFGSQTTAPLTAAPASR